MPSPISIEFKIRVKLLVGRTVDGIFYPANTVLNLESDTVQVGDPVPRAQARQWLLNRMETLLDRLQQAGAVT